jgi:serine/threonine protein kinase
VTRSLLCILPLQQDAIDRGEFKQERLPGAAPSLMPIIITAHEIAAGMSHLHKQGIVHGDLSAYNVLLSSSGAAAAVGRRGFTAKVADFGLSRSLGPQEQVVTRTYGTVSHMPPELLQDGVLSKAADVYSFGVLLWQMYTGQRPWSGLSHAAVIMRVATLRQGLACPEDMPAGLASLVGACCSSDAQERPSFEDVLEVLQPIMELAEVEQSSHGGSALQEDAYQAP